MNKKYIKYINYIVSDIEAPYFINMRDNYGLKQEEYSLIFLGIYDQPVTIKDNYVYDINGNNIYFERNDGSWAKYVYDTNGNIIYKEDSDGYWFKSEYDTNDKVIYYENSNGVIRDNR